MANSQVENRARLVDVAGARDLQKHLLQQVLGLLAPPPQHPVHEGEHRAAVLLEQELEGVGVATLEAPHQLLVGDRPHSLLHHVKQPYPPRRFRAHEKERGPSPWCASRRLAGFARRCREERVAQPPSAVPFRGSAAFRRLPFAPGFSQRVGVCSAFASALQRASSPGFSHPTRHRWAEAGNEKPAEAGCERVGVSPSLRLKPGAKGSPLKRAEKRRATLGERRPTHVSRCVTPVCADMGRLKPLNGAAALGCGRGSTTPLWRKGTSTPKQTAAWAWHPRPLSRVAQPVFSPVPAQDCGRKGRAVSNFAGPTRP
jgi:hypothetical protein